MKYEAWTRFKSKFSFLRKIYTKKLKIKKLRPNLYGKPLSSLDFILILGSQNHFYLFFKIKNKIDSDLVKN
jgi:hypothetical protein